MKIKYPRTPHLPWSPGITDDDKVMHDVSSFIGQQVVVTVKMDGENTTLGHGYVHARSLDYAPHPSRSWIKSMHAQIDHHIPEGWRICGENLFASHSIRYGHLPDFFLVFSIWDEGNESLSWEETVRWAGALGLATVPVIYEGPWDTNLIKGLHRPIFNGDVCEGYVVRVADRFRHEDFSHGVAKHVRADHVQTDDHWMHGPMTRNSLSSDRGGRECR
jgi:hypothetical protein